MPAPPALLSIVNCGVAEANLAAMVAARFEVGGRAHAAGQHDGVSGDLRLDVRARNEAAQKVVDGRQVRTDRDLQRQHAVAFGIEEEGVGLAALLGDQEYPVGGLHHRVDAARIGDEHVAQIEAEFDHHRFACAERDLAGARLVAARDLQHRAGLLDVARRADDGLVRRRGRRHGEAERQATDKYGERFHCVCVPCAPVTS